MRKFSTSTKLFFAFLFVALVFVSTKINFAQLVGQENQFFTVFQFFGPIAGGILGSLFGALIVLTALTTNFIVNLVNNSSSFELVTLLRILPMVFAAYYFGTRRKHISLVVPLIAIALFVAHPVGQQVWYFTLFWTIPIIAKFFQKRLFLRSLGATFTAHSVGGAIWIWTVPMAPEAWIALIPVVIIERLLFASGISISFVAANTLLARVESKVPFISIDKRYIFSKQIFKNF
ncbi:hypothetical protein CMO88_01400 [Candidatus Woesearchaeota archaeon]|jgi:hypothetical protein|nr:hypothetical protein [Candidatus Woesearchaeota archaeon]|tara:strand:+ start:27941 stop:28639 length:699 start_codon:yes stop_codon:yes gene_type:complete